MEKQPPEDSKESLKATSPLMSNKRRSEQERNNTTGLTNIGGTRNSQITINTNESDIKMYRDDGLECQKVAN